MDIHRLAKAFAIAMLLAVASAIAFGAIVNFWQPPASAPRLLSTIVYLLFMWPFTLFKKILPNPECEEAADYDICGANDWVYIISIPILITVHTIFIYWLLSLAAKRRHP